MSQYRNRVTAQNIRPHERQAVANVFKRARERLSPTGDSCVSPGNRKFRFICWAIEDVTTPGGCFMDKSLMSRPGRLARNVVELRLGVHSIFSEWVFHNGDRLTQRQVTRDRSDNDGRDMQAHRLAWMNMLIAEFEAPTQQGNT